MKTNKASSISWGHIICCFIILVIFVITIGVHINAKSLDGVSDNNTSTDSSEVLPLKDTREELLKNINITSNDEVQNEVELAGPKEEVTVKRTELDCYITIYLDDIKLLAKIYSVNYEDLIDDLYNRYELYYNEYGFNETNVGYILNKNKLSTFKNIQYGLVEYISDYINKNPSKVKTRKKSYTGGSSYVENLIIYLTKYIYTNVDTNIALSIGAAESGYYQVEYMLSVGNVYGGMSSSGLIHYNNIEEGVLSYIKMLSNNYFGKGLNTISKIGYTYCPSIYSNGNKVASPHWISLVSTAMKKYSNRSKNITASDLL